MTDRDFHAKPGECGPQIVCRFRPTPWYALLARWFFQWILFILPAAGGFTIAALSLAFVFWPPLKTEIAYCASMGPLDSERRVEEGFSPPADHPPGMCRDVKSILEQSIDYQEIAETTCEACKNNTTVTPDAPLILPDSEIRLTRTAKRYCGQFDWLIEYYDESDNFLGDDPLFDPEAAGQLPLPNFCVAGEWSWVLIEQPRVYYSVSTVWTDTNGDGEAQPDELTTHQAPYIMFIAMEEKSRRIANAYFVYVDALSRRPNVVEVSFESLKNKSLISIEGNAQLVSNLRLSSDRKEITFQIGSRAYEMTIAGYDFGQVSNRGLRPGAGQRDTSGAYIIKLEQSGAVSDVVRR